MFRRRWSGLPEDPIYPDTLEGLGYFINSQDEVRNIQNPNAYFKYFISKNDRWNERQRFHMNRAVGTIIHARLTAQGLTTLRLPLHTPPTAPHVLILASATLPTASRVVLLVGEPDQDLGVLAHRVVGGPRGVAAGSMVSVVAALAHQRASAADARPPAVVLANPGELFWWPAGAAALSARQRHGVPAGSAVGKGVYYDEACNGVPGNLTPQEHVASVFREVLVGMKEGARLDVVGIGGGAEEVEEFLNNEENWKTWGPRMQSLVLVGGFFARDRIKVEGFRTFLKERAHAYIVCNEPVDTPVAGTEGNPESAVFTDYGCPVFSSGEPYHSEMMFINAKEAILDWIQEVALDDDYCNPTIIVNYGDKQYTDETAWGDTSENVNTDKRVVELGSDDE